MIAEAIERLCVRRDRAPGCLQLVVVHRAHVIAHITGFLWKERELLGVILLGVFCVQGNMGGGERRTQGRTMHSY